MSNTNIQDIQTIDIITKPKSADDNDDIAENNPIRDPSQPTHIANRIHPIVLLLYRIMDGKHDFGGGGESDRSYLNEHDCNTSILKVQMDSNPYILDSKTNFTYNETSNIRHELKQMSLIKTLKRVNNPETIIWTSNITSKADTIHPIFDFCSGLEAYPYIKGDKLEIKANIGDIPYGSYVVDRPFFAEYDLFKSDKKSGIQKLTDDYMRYKTHGIFVLKIGKNEDTAITNLKTQTETTESLAKELNKIFAFDESQYTIDATHIHKTKMLKDLLFGRESESIFGDHMDPATGRGLQTYGIQPSKKHTNQYTNRFHYCFIRGKPMEVELQYRGDYGKMKIIFHYDQESESFLYPQKPMDPHGLAPSVTDISLHIYTHYLNVKNVPSSSIMELFGKVTHIAFPTSKNKVHSKGPSREAYFNQLFEIILTIANNLCADRTQPLTIHEVMVLLTSVKTIGDQVRLIDTQNLSMVTTPLHYAWCATLDKFLFDFGVATRKCCLLGDTSKKDLFEIIVYSNKQDNTKADDQIFVNSAKRLEMEIQQLQSNSEISSDLKAKIALLSDSTKSKSDRISAENELKQIVNGLQIQVNKRVLVNQLTEKQSVLSMTKETELYEAIQKYEALLYGDETLKKLLEEKGKSRRYNLASFMIQNESQSSIVAKIQKIHMEYYLVNLIRYCLSQNIEIENQLLEQVVSLPTSTQVSYAKQFHEMSKVYGKFRFNDTKMEKIRKFLSMSIVPKLDNTLYVVVGCMTTTVKRLGNIELPPMDTIQEGGSRSKSKSKSKSTPKSKPTPKSSHDTIADIGDAFKFFVHEEFVQDVQKALINNTRLSQNSGYIHDLSTFLLLCQQDVTEHGIIKSMKEIEAVLNEATTSTGKSEKIDSNILKRLTDVLTRYICRYGTCVEIDIPETKGSRKSKSNSNSTQKKEKKQKSPIQSLKKKKKKIKEEQRSVAPVRIRIIPQQQQQQKRKRSPSPTRSLTPSFSRSPSQRPISRQTKKAKKSQSPNQSPNQSRKIHRHLRLERNS